MQKTHGRSKLGSILLLMLLLLAGFAVRGGASAIPVQAAATTTKQGFVKEGKYTYYYNADGTKHKGWLSLNGKKYYFYKGSGAMATGWLQDSKGNKRYFHKTTGAMYTGWVKNSTGKRYFSKSSGIMAVGWLSAGENRYYFSKNGYAARGFVTISKKIRYFYSNSCVMARGWLTNGKGETRYFLTSSEVATDGVMATKFQTISGKTYYFYSGSGKLAKGWVTNSKKGYKYYFDKSTGEMATGIVAIDGTKYEFAENGILIGEYSPDPQPIEGTGTKTIKNYLLGALLPVGKALYVWGGGWNDSTRKGISPTWVDWYNSQSSYYDFNYYSDLSVSNRAKGLDCSGFVGWAAYQVMHSKSGEGYGYTVVSGDVGESYRNRGWGSIINQSYLSSHDYVLKAGDIGYNSGHVWIVIGQCADKSVVLVHSTPQAGCQISGSATPSGNSNSQAAALAEKYMQRYSGISKYKYSYSVGNYIPRYNYLRWNSSVLSDPDGYMNMTADQILADLFS